MVDASQVPGGHDARKQESGTVAALPAQPRLLAGLLQNITSLLRSVRRPQLVAAPSGASNYREVKSFRLPEPVRGVAPANARMAQDQQLTTLYGDAYGWDGCGFMGFALLSDLAQVPEYRKPVELFSNEMTREWGKVVSKSDSDVRDKIKKIEDELDRIQAKEWFRRAYEQDNFFGHGKLFIDLGNDWNDPDLAKPLDVKVKVDKGSLKSLRTIEPIWIYPNDYNSFNPLDDWFYRPQTWYVMGRRIHSSRFMTFISNPVPDILKPAYMFAGLSMTQILQPYVDNWLRTRQSVSDITHNFSTPVLKGDLGQMLIPGAQDITLARLDLFNTARDNQGVMFLDKEKEDFSYASANLGSLDKLQAQAQEQQAGIMSVPLIKYFGLQPAGLNATSEGEIRSFYDLISSKQERIGTPNILRLLDVVQMSLFGEIDPDIGWSWNPLWSLDEEKQAQVDKVRSEIDASFVDRGILDPHEVREALVSEEDSRYANIDPDDMPEPPGQEEGEGEEPPSPDIGGEQEEVPQKEVKPPRGEALPDTHLPRTGSRKSALKRENEGETP